MVRAGVYAQYAVGHRVVVTIREAPDAFAYEVREPTPPAETLDRVEVV